jgi:predicted CopG family antitoxin
MTRQVSLSEEAYKTLSKIKGKEMSFSDIVLKLVSATSPKRNFLKFAGIMKSQSVELEQFKKQIEKDRKRNMEVM